MSDYTELCYCTSADLDAAERFLKLLDSTATASFDFRTFADKREDENLIRKYHGTLSQHAATLQRLNEKGAGVFVTVNQTDGKGCKAENITRIRAVYVDLDGAPLEPVMQAHLPPHIVVESSPNKWHAYWLVDGMALQDFTPVQKALIGRFHADPTIHDLPRVMRLPGFIHRKREPFLVHIVDGCDWPAYPAVCFERRKEPPHVSGDKEPASQIDIVLAVTALEILPPAMEWVNRNYIGMATWRATDGSIEGFEAWCRWLQRSGRFNLQAAQRQWRRYFKSTPVRIGLGTLIFLADQIDPNWRQELGEYWRLS